MLLRIGQYSHSVARTLYCTVHTHMITLGKAIKQSTRNLQIINYLRKILACIAVAQISAEECIALIWLDDFINFIRNIKSIHIQQTIECP